MTATRYRVDSIQQKPVSAPSNAPRNCWRPNRVRSQNCANGCCKVAAQPIVESVIQRLSEYGYLDDARFAHSYASLRVQQRPIGRQRLQRDLWLKKIDKATANEALDLVFAATPEEELIDRAIEKRLRLHGRPQSRAETKKLFDHLLRQGFAFELIGEKLRTISSVEVDEDV